MENEGLPQIDGLFIPKCLTLKKEGHSLLVLLLSVYVSLSKNSFSYALHPVFRAKADAKVRTLFQIRKRFEVFFYLLFNFFFFIYNQMFLHLIIIYKKTYIGCIF